MAARRRGRLRATGVRLPAPRPGDVPTTDVDDAARRYLLYVLMPFWTVPAFADYVFHKRSHIEDTTGLTEAALHTAMMAEMGAAVGAALTLRITRPVFLAIAGCTLAHAVTSAVDVRVAYDSPRELRPGEQHAHGFLEVLPWTALGTIASLHWQQIRHPQPGAPRLALRRPPLPRWYLLSAAGAAIAGVSGPYADEMRRCIRARRRRGCAALERDDHRGGRESFQRASE